MRSRVAHLLVTGGRMVSHSGLLLRVTASALAVMALFTAFLVWRSNTSTERAYAGAGEGQLLAIARSFAAEIGPGALRDDAAMQRRLDAFVRFNPDLRKATLYRLKAGAPQRVASTNQAAPGSRRAPHQAGAQQGAPDRAHGQGRAPRARAAAYCAAAAPANARRERVFDLRGVSVAFGEEPVLVGVDLTVVHGERVGVVGENGAGKSILLKTVVGQLEPEEGEVWVGPSIKVGYLAQDHETLDPRATAIETIRAARPLAEGEAVSILLKFLFSLELIRRPTSTLSGGERTRLQLLLLMLGGANLLVLDEPTNHLDIDSVEVLEAELERFSGTVVAISHDRYFLDRIADRIVEVAGGDVRLYEGGYSDWARARQRAESGLVREYLGS